MAVIGAINGFAPASAPVLGGFISQTWGWRGVFVFLFVYALVMLFLSRKLKETLPAATRRKVTLRQSFGTYAILFRNRRFLSHCILKGVGLGLLFAYISSAPFIMQTHYGFSQDTFGLIMGGNALMLAVGSMMALKFKTLTSAAQTGAAGVAVTVPIECYFLFFTDSFLGYELMMLPILFSLGMIFTASNTMAMNEGRQYAGGASSMLGIFGYLFGAPASPLVGLGNILHSTAIVYLVLVALMIAAARLARKNAEDPTVGSRTK